MLILIGLFICHWIADYNFTTIKMIEAKATGSPLLPIALHALIHAILMTCWVVFFEKSLSLLFEVFFLQFLSHFVIDTLKGKITKLKADYANLQKKIYWQFYGFDQLLHAIVIIGINIIVSK